MRFGVYVPTVGEYDVPAIAGLAREAEEAGWDGLFVWDHLIWVPDGLGTRDLADPTVALAAIALATSRIRFGALVTPLVRRRPWKLAKETATLDRLSGGRLVMGTGLGTSHDLDPVGEGADPRARAAELDEALGLVARLWSGEPVTHRGARFRVEGAALRPPPLQRPRIPVWIAGFWLGGPPFRRAARWDGVVPLRRDALIGAPSPEELRALAGRIRAARGSLDGYDVVVPAGPDERREARAAAYADAGATWWLDAVDPRAERLEDLRARVRAGPPG